MNKHFIIVACIFAFAGIAIGTAASNKKLRSSSVMIPKGNSCVKDVHAVHLSPKIACAKCHPKAEKSGWASDRLVPDMADCGPCHSEVNGISVFSRPNDSCNKCHTKISSNKLPVRSEYPRPNIRFSHKSHKDIGCSDCHLAAGGKTATGPGLDVIGMKTCYACHNKRPGASTKCRTCHLTHSDGRMITQLNGKLLTPPNWLAGNTHGENWAGSHAAKAGADSAFCSSCHRDKFCQDCHTGRLRPRNIHPGDWVASHGINTRMGNPNCAGCHRSQTFCITCHRRTGVAPDSPYRTKAANSGNYHKAKSPAQICKRARYDITSCVSCHSESSCIKCHVAINPHPAGWSKRCKPLASRNQRACAKCHQGSVWKRCK